MPLPRLSLPVLRLLVWGWLVAAAGSAAAAAAGGGSKPRHPQRRRLVRSEAALQLLSVGARGEVTSWPGQDGKVKEEAASWPEQDGKAQRPVLQRLQLEAYDGNRFWSLGKPVKDDFTISLQFRTNSTAGSEASWLAGVGLLGAARKGLEGNYGLEGDYGLAMGDGKVLFGNGKRTIASSRSYADDRWHTAVANRDRATGACSLWVDGVFQRTIAASKGSLKPARHMDIGRITPEHGYFVGYLKNVEIYDQLLTPDEIDFAKEVEAKKRRAREHQAVLEEMQVQDFLGDTFRRYKRLVQDDFTIVLEFKTGSSAGSSKHWWAGLGLVGAAEPGASEDFGLSLGGGHVLFGLADPETTIVSGGRYDDDHWHTVVAERTRSSGEFRLWVDGVLQASAVGPKRSLSSAEHLDVGRLSNGSGYFRGYLRGLRIFAEALTPLDLGLKAVNAIAEPDRMLLQQSATEEAEPSAAFLEDCPADLKNPAEVNRSYSSVYLIQQPGDSYARSKLDSDQAWTASTSRPGEWLQLDLGSALEVAATVVQGRKDLPQWVTGYRVNCSLDKVHWTEVQEDFMGNSDQNTKVTNRFPYSMQARYVRLVVMSYHIQASMRAAVLVCKDQSTSGRRRRSSEANAAASFSKSWKFCANEGQDCNCSGIMAYGQGSRWTSLRVDGQTLCAARNFRGARPALEPSLVRECRCRDLSWCLEAERSGSVRMRHDRVHRRRVSNGTKGINLYQRRRACGWGPRDCIYGDWGFWGPCLQDCREKRERTLEISEKNGGNCAASEEFRACNNC